MLNLELFKKTLGKRGDNLTIQEIEKLFELQKKIANLLFDAWHKNIKISQTVEIKVSKKNGNFVTIYMYSYTYLYAKRH